jgi:4-hydroxy-3-methylbut-2-enyl diphosphate reductase
VERSVYELIEQRGLKLVDATCPFVLKIHNIVMEKSTAGYDIIIIGNENHPEVQGIKGWSSAETFVINTEEEAEKLRLETDKKYCIVAQTTFNYKKFDKMVEILEKKGYDIVVANTICNATNERQTEARRIASSSDAMIVIGGSHSSNTQKLYEICKEECKNTYYIQKLEDLEMATLKTCSIVGITAGASTPNNIIEEVQTNVRI